VLAVYSVRPYLLGRYALPASHWPRDAATQFPTTQYSL